ncbi:hypothetical protein MLD38_005444 [Melastoma candidum]|uniref:Uncharacterized protein n=1 Tax=Melastoma candidum TaxID=119954 RepID=A0ACB9RJG2_9MYRT|nr:hypothetical protein MLD38_005444 [Melastoma candidum]
MKSGHWGLVCSLVILVGFVSSAVGVPEARKLDESTTPGAGEKCIPCAQASPPPPPPPVPCPPPPPPPAPKKPPTPSIYNCPPPPSTYIYITGPPGSLYPVDQYFNGAEKRLTLGWWLSTGVGLIGVMFLW